MPVSHPSRLRPFRCCWPSARRQSSRFFPEAVPNSREKTRLVHFLREMTLYQQWPVCCGALFQGVQCRDRQWATQDSNAVSIRGKDRKSGRGPSLSSYPESQTHPRRWQEIRLWHPRSGSPRQVCLSLFTATKLLGCAWLRRISSRPLASFACSSACLSTTAFWVAKEALPRCRITIQVFKLGDPLSLDQSGSPLNTPCRHDSAYSFASEMQSEQLVAQLHGPQFEWKVGPRQ